MKDINPFGYSYSPMKVVQDLKRVSGVSIDSTTSLRQKAFTRSSRFVS